MRFPSLFRVAKNTRFNYEPRYYDPIREDLDQRVSRIHKEIESDNHQDLRSSFRDTYERKKKAGRKASTNQIMVLTLIAGGTVGWLYFGNSALFALLLIFPLYIYFRFRGRT